MKSQIIGAMFKYADDDDYISIYFADKYSTFKSAHIDYCFMDKGNYLEINDRHRNELNLFRVDSIDVIRVFPPKF